MSNISSVIEAIIFASDEAITLDELMNIVEVSKEEIKEGLSNLIDRYQRTGALEIRATNDGYILVIKQQFNEYLKKMKPARSNTLSRASLEVLSIIAFKQPITRVEINELRGVSSDSVVNSLLSKGLIEVVGRLDTIGRPIIYGTSKEFLEFFGLDSIEELPKPEDIKL
ncbi:MAG: SMC-Scp complex subunit ScpB [Halanaerobiales bacterium]